MNHLDALLAVKASALDAVMTYHGMIMENMEMSEERLRSLTAWSQIHATACHELDSLRMPAKAIAVKTLINTALLRINCLHAVQGSIQENCLAAQAALIRALAELEE
jgi:hypothetical protein